MRRFTRSLIIAGLALVVVLTTCSPLWQVGGRAGATVISAWRPTTGPVVARAVPAATAAPLVAQAVPVVKVNPPTPPATAVPPPPATQPADQLGRAIDSYLSDLVDAKLFQGAVLVARGGQVVLSRGYGLADGARGVANTPKTRFRLASVTKQFTATAIMILQAQGKLRVNDSICAYLDDCPDAWQPITIHHLLTHTSGLPNYTDFAEYEETQAQPTTPSELIGRFRDVPLLFPPGTQYYYENSDYMILGRIVERAAGRTYADFLRDAIFAPLGMRDSGVALGTRPGPGEAAGYRVVGEPAPALDPSTLFAAGSLYSTVEDMYRWDQALYTPRLLPQPLLDTMWTPYANNYGYGWMLDSAFGQRRIGHPGLIDGFATLIERYPDTHVTIIVLSNMSAGDVHGIGDYIASLVFGGS